jgi:SAM-dependent methyltransferase
MPTAAGMCLLSPFYDGGMPYDEELAERLRQLLSGEPRLTERKMFGGLAFLIGGNMAISASGQGGLLVRVDPDESDKLVTTSNAEVAVMRGRPMDGWLRVAADDVRTTRRLATWANLGTACARSLPAKKWRSPASHERYHERVAPIVATLGVVVGDPLWEQHAAWWQAEFTDGADPEYEEQILPLIEQYLVGARRVLDAGCGEGQLSRRIASVGVEVVGLDPTAAQIRTAGERGGSARYMRARSEQIPCPDASFDAVVLCLAIEHVDPFEPAIDEVARVTAPGGLFLLLLVHPLLQSPGSGWVEDLNSDDRFWRIGTYLQDDVAIDEIAPGVHLQFAHRPLNRYVHAMGQAGLLIEDMVEPAPPPAILIETGNFPNASAIPRLMLLCARRIG